MQESEKSVSMETALTVTGVSRRTLWRRIAEGAIRKCVKRRAINGGV
jgi:predicted DNA-binding transcriptional regulator AlpA